MKKIKLLVVASLMGLGLTAAGQKVNYDYKVDSVTTGKLSTKEIGETTAYPSTVRFEQYGDSMVVKFGMGREMKSFYVSKMEGANMPNPSLCAHLFEVTEVSTKKVYRFGIMFLASTHEVLAVTFVSGDQMLMYSIKEDLTLEG
jgi:hypothetical protein